MASTLGSCLSTIVPTLAAVVLVLPQALAQDNRARETLKMMSDYLTSQHAISATFDSDIEVITSDLQKLQFNSSGTFLLVRPDKLRVARTGGLSDVELIFDGKTVAIHDRRGNAFAKAEMPGSIDQLIDRLRGDYAVEAPGADLLLSHVYDELIPGVLDAKLLAPGVIDGVFCDHLAFRDHDTDWQIWVELGPLPIPRKYVITNKSVTGAPQYTLRIRDWKTDVPIVDSQFVFTPPNGARQLDLTNLTEIDEIPVGAATGGRR